MYNIRYNCAIFKSIFSPWHQRNWLFLPKPFKIKKMIELNPSDWADQMAKDPQAIIVDVRSDMELEEGKIPGAIQCNIQYSSEFMSQIQAMDPNKNYYVYCRSGGRSAQACMLMNASGIKNTYNLLGGITAWDGPTE
jgi:rhodanese-related sulfurtransferase